MAAAISRMRSLPAGCRRTRAVSAPANRTAMAPPPIAYRTRFSIFCRLPLSRRPRRSGRGGTHRWILEVPIEVIDRDAGDDIDAGIASLLAVIGPAVERLLTHRKGIRGAVRDVAGHHLAGRVEAVVGGRPGPVDLALGDDRVEILGQLLGRG